MCNLITFEGRLFLIHNRSSTTNGETLMNILLVKYHTTNALFVAGMQCSFRLLITRKVSLFEPY